MFLACRAVCQLLDVKGIFEPWINPSKELSSSDFSAEELRRLRGFSHDVNEFWPALLDVCDFHCSWKVQQSGRCRIVKKVILWIPDHTGMVPMDRVSEQLLQHPALLQMCAASSKGPWGRAPLQMASVPQRALRLGWWTRESAVSIRHLMGRAPNGHVTVPPAEIWRGRPERDSTPVLQNVSPHLSQKVSRLLIKAYASSVLGSLRASEQASFRASSLEKSNWSRPAKRTAALQKQRGEAHTRGFPALSPRVIGGDQKTLRFVVKGRPQDKALCVTWVLRGAPCGQCDSAFILVTAWDTHIFIRKVGADEGRGREKTIQKQPGNS